MHIHDTSKYFTRDQKFVIIIYDRFYILELVVNVMCTRNTFCTLNFVYSAVYDISFTIKLSGSIHSITVQNQRSDEWTINSSSQIPTKLMISSGIVAGPSTLLPTGREQVSETNYIENLITNRSLTVSL